MTKRLHLQNFPFPNFSYHTPAAINTSMCDFEFPLTKVGLTPVFAAIHSSKTSPFLSFIDELHIGDFEIKSSKTQ